MDALRKGQSEMATLKRNSSQFLENDYGCRWASEPMSLEIQLAEARRRSHASKYRETDQGYGRATQGLREWLEKSDSSFKSSKHTAFFCIHAVPSPFTQSRGANGYEDRIRTSAFV